MFKISTHICEELKDSNVTLMKLNNENKNRILNLVFNNYIDSNIRGCFLWEKFIHCETLSDNMAWSYIKDFIKNNECIMFFNQDEEEEMFYIQSGDDLIYILSETYGYEFYITDGMGTYLLCFNHHNILYGCGAAEEWIRNRR